MKKLYVRTSYEELEIEDIEPSDIKEDKHYMIFGDKAKVNKNLFVYYQFLEVKEHNKENNVEEKYK